MFSLISDIITGCLIFIVILILNGNLKTASIKVMPLHGFFRHRIFIQTPYMLLYFYLVTTIILPIIQLLQNDKNIASHAFVAYTNSGIGLLLFFYVLLLQIVGIILVFSIWYKKGFVAWGSFVLRIKEIAYQLSRPKSGSKPAKESSIPEPIDTKDIQYLFSCLIFPALFILTNAYFLTNLFINLKLL